MVRFAMSVSNSAENPLQSCKWLFIESRSRAISFLLVSLLVLVSIALFNYQVGWTSFISRFESKPTAVQVKTALRAASLKHSDATNLLLLGGSTTRELTGKSEYISTLLSDYCSVPVNVINAGSSSQSLSMSRIIFDSFPAQSIDAVVIGLNFYRFTESEITYQRKIVASSYIFPPKSGGLQGVINSQNLPGIEPFFQLGKSLREYFVTENLFFAGDRPDVAEESESPYIAAHNYYTGAVLDGEKKHQRVRRFALFRWPGYDKYFSEASRQWLDFQRHTMGSGSKFGHLVLPYDRQMSKVEALFNPIMDDFLEASASAGGEVIDWRAENLGLRDDAFFDQQHLTPLGRQLIYPELVKRLAIFVTDCTVG